MNPRAKPSLDQNLTDQNTMIQLCITVCTVTGGDFSRKEAELRFQAAGEIGLETLFQVLEKSSESPIHKICHVFAHGRLTLRL